jgi:plastocyanin
MTWRWLICFSLAAGAAGGGSVSGTVALRDSTVKRGNFGGVVVSLTPVNGAAVSLEPRRFRMLQKDKMFTPHVLPILTGSTVDFPNADPIFHNAFSSYSGQVFDVGLYPPGTTRSVRFTRPGVVRVFCNIHAAMSAVVLVLDTPYFATTGPDGSYRIEGVPAGEYQLNVFHERATEATLKALSRRVTVGAAGVAMPQISISEAGYLPAPHKNKFGNDYPPGIPNDTFYPGARK